MTRDRWPVDGQMFVAMPYGVKELADGGKYDFDRFFDVVLEPAVRECGMKAVRADSIYGPQAVGEAIWRGIQEAELVLVDFTGRSANVALEYGWAQVLGKRMVIITMDPEDIPSDLRGYRYIRYSASDSLSILQMVNELKATIKAVRTEPANEMVLTPMPGAGLEVTPARVVSVEAEFVTVEALDHSRRAVLASEDVSYARLVPDLRKRFKIGEIVEGGFEIDLRGGTKYTLVGGQTNPWPELVTGFPVGSTVTGVVRNMTDFGVFVEVTRGINGMVPKAMIPSHIQLYPGSEVEAVVTSIDADRRQIGLRLAGSFVAASARTGTATPPVPGFSYAVGQHLDGEVVRVNVEKGFALIDVGDGTWAILHATKMSADLREDFTNGNLELGEILTVEVVAVDPSRRRVQLRDIPDPDVDATDDTLEDIAA